MGRESSQNNRPAERTVWPCLAHGVIDLHLEMDGLAEATGCGDLQCPIILSPHYPSLYPYSFPLF